MPDEMRRLTVAVNRPIITVAFCISAALLVFVVLAQIVPVIYHFIPPYVVRLAELEKDGDATDNKISIKYRVLRRRICIVDLDRFVRSVPSGDVVWRNRVPGGAVPIGTTDIINRIELPADIEPGDYELQTNIANQCPEGLHMASTPPVRFKIIPKASPKS